MGGYQHARGVHCGSAALRNLFAANGLLLSEPMVFGLGAGLGFALCEGARGLQPPLPERFFIGRSLAYEEDLCASVGAKLEVLRFDSADAAWSEARARIEKDQAPLAYVDLFYLPYLGARGHWFGHLLALAKLSEARDENGEPRSVLVGDNERAQLEEVPLANLKNALCGASASPSNDRLLLSIGGIHPLSPEQLREACAVAIALQAKRLREPALPMRIWRDVSNIAALDSLRALPAELRSWKDAPDLARRLRFAAQVIEVRGNGGGLFRRLYTAFLQEAESLGVREAAPLIPLCQQSADAFTALATKLEKLRELNFVKEAHARSSFQVNHLTAPEIEEVVQLAEKIIEAETALLAAMPH